MHVSGVVANNMMNRGRGLAGSNSYQKDLSFNPVEFLLERLENQESVSWLDIACGEGRALIEAATVLAGDPSPEKRSKNLQITGIDLAGMFGASPPGLKHLRLQELPVEDYEPEGEEFDLITSVHGLHYIGDKLSVIQKAAGWLKKDGIFLANLELTNLKLAGKGNPSRTFSAFFRKQSFDLDLRKHLLKLQGRRQFDLPFSYLGADDKAGPNSTGQPAVDSYYQF